MNKEEYIVINKTAIQKRIEELERLYKNSEKPSIEGTVYNKLNIELKKFLSQSTPLIPEIEKAFDEGSESPRIAGSYPTFERLKEQQKDKKDYISNLKLDI